MKRTILPTKFEYIRFIYLNGILKIILFALTLTVLSFVGLAAVLRLTDFNEKLLGSSVLIITGVCLAIGIAAGTFLHGKSLVKSSYYIKPKKIKLYLICNCIYSLIIYLLFMMII